MSSLWDITGFDSLFLGTTIRHNLSDMMEINDNLEALCYYYVLFTKVRPM